MYYTALISLDTGELQTVCVHLTEETARPIEAIEASLRRLGNLDPTDEVIVGENPAMECAKREHKGFRRPLLNLGCYH